MRGYRPTENKRSSVSSFDNGLRWFSIARNATELPRNLSDTNTLIW